VAEESVETARLMVVSRESNLLTPLWSISESNAWQIETAINGWDALERIQSGSSPNLLLLDLSRGDGDSHHVLRSLRRIHPSLPAIVVCSPEDADRNQEAIRLGAQEVLIKPLDDAQLEWVIRRYLASPESGKGKAAGGDIEPLGRDPLFVSASPISEKLKTQVQVLAEAEVAVLILGESGSGKDTVARLIHRLSIHSGFEFVKVNCADTPAELLEAELFGSAIADDGRAGAGKLERANNGTIFFDEITEMPPSLQGRLMHLLESKASPKPGANQAARADFRVLAATSANIERALAEGKLREDLYCRLSAFTIQVPPLRQRRSEIVVLMQHLMHRLSKQYGLPPRTFSSAALNACRNYSWPGNLTELENFVKRYLVVGDKDLTFNGVRPHLTRAHQEHISVAAGPTGDSDCAGDTHTEPEVEGRECEPKSLKSFVNSVKGEAERKAIEMALHKTGWNRKAAARLLQVSYRTLLYKIDQYHMSAPQSYVGGFLYNGTNGGGKELK